jgi:hypothetical protein
MLTDTAMDTNLRFLLVIAGVILAAVGLLMAIDVLRNPRG